MSIRVDMKLVRPGLIATAACALAWWFVVQPVHERLLAAKAHLSEQKAIIRQLAQANAEGGLSASDELAAWSSRAQELSRYVRGRTDAASVYEQFTVLAQKYDVRIKRIDPRKNQRLRKVARAKSDPKVQVIEFGYKIDLEGGFEQIARFIDAIALHSPLCMVTTINLTPVVRGKRHLVNATIETTHCRLDRHLLLAKVQEQGQ